MKLQLQIICSTSDCICSASGTS